MPGGGACWESLRFKDGIAFPCARVARCPLCMQEAWGTCPSVAEVLMCYLTMQRLRNAATWTAREGVRAPVYCTNFQQD
jgi:hypothetical protein